MSNEKYIKGGSFLIDEILPENIFTPEDFSDEQKMIADTTREFVDKEVLPFIHEIDEQKEGLSISLMRKAGEIGLLSVDIPTEYDGLGLDKTSTMLVAENIGRTGAWAVTQSAHTGIGTLPIVYFGTEEQKKKYLPKFGTGEWITSYSLSEPGAGSDALAAQTTAVLSDDKKFYILNGTKMWLSNAGFADVYITFAKIDGEHFSAFIIEKNSPGVSTGAEEKKLGIKGSSTRTLILENAMVPVENLLGEIGRAHLIAFNILNIGRFKLGAAVIGASKKIISDSVQYSNQRKQFNRKISEFGLIKNKLSQMLVKTFVGESMIYRTAGMIDSILSGVDESSPNSSKMKLKGIEEYAIECSILKVYCSEILDFVADEGVQILGGYGYSEEYPMARAYRDARINRIFEGTNEINKMLTTGMTLKRSVKGEIGVLSAAMKLASEILSGPVSFKGDDENIFSVEQQLIKNSKNIAVLVLGASAQKYMDKINDEEEILDSISDIMMEVYAMESVLLRVQKGLKNGKFSEVHTKMAKVFCNDTMPKIETHSKKIISTLYDGDMQKTYLTALKRLTKFTPINSIALHREIASFLIDKNDYPF